MSANTVDTDSPSLIKIGVSLGDKGQWREALNYFEKAAMLDDNSALAHYNIGCAKDDLGDKTGAMLSYLRAAELGWADADYNLALIYTEQGNPFEAAKHLLAYKKRKKNDPSADKLIDEIKSALVLSGKKSSKKEKGK